MGYTLQQLQAMGAKPATSAQGGSLTLEQLQQMGAKPMARSPFAPGGSQFTQPTPAGATKMQYASGSGVTTASQFGFGSLGAGISQTTHSLVDPVIGGAKEFANDTSQAFQGGLQQGREGVAQISNTRSANPYDLISGVGKVGSGFIQSAFSPYAAPLKPVSNATNYAADKISNNPVVQRFSNSKVGQIVAQGAGDVVNYSNIAGAVGGAMEAPHATNIANNGLNTFADSAKPGLNAVKNDVISGVNKVGEVPKQIRTGLENKYIKQATTEWNKPATVTKPAYNKATEIFNRAKTQGNNIGETLVKNKINLSDHIENGAYSTAETAENLHNDAIKLSNEMLRPSLEKANFSTPKTPVKEVIKTATDNINKNKGLTPEMKVTLIGQLQKTQEALESQFPEGMSLTDLHDEKIVRDINSKYSPVGDIATNNEAIKNKAIADSSRKTLEAKAPKEVPVEQFNAELAKQHQAANYLEALNGKKVPVSLGSRIAKTSAKVLGAAVGQGLGGGILGGVGGYHIGGMVEGLLENLPNPIKNSFIKNLEATNPEAFTKLQNYLKYSPGQLLLPAPRFGSPQASVNVPIEGRAGNADVINPGLKETQNMKKSRFIKPKYTPTGGKVTQIFGQPK